MAERKYFKVLGHCETADAESASTFHYSNEVAERHRKVTDALGDGKCVDAFVVDKAHPNGNEIHYIYDNGVILIANERTRKVITELIARPRQLYRYWDGLGEPFPKEYGHIIDLAVRNEFMGRNYW